MVEARAMAEISAKDIAALRKQTGAGMLDCKRALEECDGDVEGAKDWLRTQGLAGAAKRAGREAQDGAVDVVVDRGVGAIVELNCETDFVAKGADFRGIVTALTKLVAEQGDSDLDGKPFEGGTVGDAVNQLGAKLGENVSIGRVARIESADGIVDGYKHIQNERGTIGVLVEVGGVDRSDARAREVAHDVALHVASAAPQYVKRDDVPVDVVEKERAVLEELTRNEGKPEQAIPKIVEGRLNGFYKSTVLVEQPFIREPKTTVGKLLGELGKDATVLRFVRIQVGAE
jgi:elongation factor Ts